LPKVFIFDQNEMQNFCNGPSKHLLSRAPTTFKLEVEVTSLSESSQGEVGYNKEKWGDFWEKSIAINQNIDLPNIFPVHCHST
jgi:hypothetical protein